MPNAISTYVTFANLQMAAESIFPIGFTQGLIPNSTLTTGNNRSSTFTPSQAAQFVQDWEVVDHKPNTSTGFSGTLFKYIGTNTDPNVGPVNGQLVVSLRSTEFVDDAVRDTQATNNIEISNGGWAIGQIADMKVWFDSLNTDPAKLQGKNFSITGYSLGGHLATALNLLYPSLSSRIAATYTFNGAGVGRVNSNTSLLSVVDQFSEMRGDSRSAFTDAGALAAYDQLRSRYRGSAVVATPEAIGAIAGDMEALAANTQIADPVQGDLLYKALGRIKTIMEEAGRIANFGSGLPNQPPLQSVTSNVEAVNLDYQIAVLLSQRSTSNIAVASTLIRKPGDFPIANMFDVFGDTSFSAVANSQLHYGQATPILIEDQPLYRGTAPWDFAAQSFAYWGIKLLQNGFSVNDFGDTHSLVLLVDSLSVQRAFAALDPNTDQSVIDRVLRGASNAVKDSISGTQGQAEFDTLERIAKSLGDITGASKTVEWHAMNPNPAGGSWAKREDEGGHTGRDLFHANLKAVMDKIGNSSGLAGQVRVVASHESAGARNDFAALLSLVAGATFSLRLIDPSPSSSATVALGAANPELFQQWQADRGVIVAGGDPNTLNFSDSYLGDRSLLLNNLASRNDRNSNLSLELDSRVRNDRVVDIQYDDSFAGQTKTLSLMSPAAPAGFPTNAPRQLIAFSSDLDNTLNGTGETKLGDRLYGGAGNDTLNGQAGADYIEGNAGNDSLVGGTDNDTLLGGTGLDTYDFTGTWGHDTVDDRDANGIIQVQGLGQLTGTNARKIAPDAWHTDDRRVNYTLVPMDGTTNDLYISFSDRPDVITLRNWSDGLSGITLEQTLQTPTAPPPDQTLVLTDPPGPEGAISGVAVGSPLAHLIFGTPDTDSVSGSLAGDQIVGNGGGDHLYGNEGGDRLYAGGIVDLQTAIDVADLPLSGPPPTVSDVLEGGPGDDMLFGGASSWLYSGGGRDTIVGGGSIDLVQGDTYNGGSSSSNTGIVTPHYEYDPVKHKYNYYVSATAGEQTSYFARLGYEDIDGAGDVILTGAGDDIADGELGDDRIELGAGSDIGVGGAGSDTVAGDGDDDLIFGDFNADESTPTGAEPEQWQLNYAGLAGAEHGEDLLMGGDGNDLIWGNGADDQIYGGAGADRLRGDDFITPITYQGNDYLDGGDGNDEVAGDGGDDEVFGGAGDDSLFGDDLYVEQASHGDDYVYGEDGVDYLVGGGGADALFGGEGNDSLFGDGDDIDSAYQGSDYLHGGAGDDYLFGYGGDDELRGGVGDDVLAADAGNDVLSGDDGADILAAGDGNDALMGGMGDDQLQGEAGDDTLDGGGGADYLDGGAGNDTYRIAAEESSTGLYRDSIHDANGSDTLELDGVTLSSVQVAHRTDGYLELAWGPQQSVLIEQGLTSSLSTLIIGGESTSLQKLVNERLTTPVDLQSAYAGGTVLGGGGGDTIIVNHAGNRVAAGGGNDVIDLQSTAGATVLATVGQGMDQLLAVPRDSVSTPGARNVLELDEGVDASVLRIYRVGGNTYALSLNEQGDGFNFTAGDGSSPIALGDWPFDVVRMTDGTELPWQQILDRGVGARSLGTEGNDLVSLTPSDDSFSGLGGDDHVEGLAGNDSLSGDAGNDWISGGDGNDSLDGGDGTDSLKGNAGNDTLSGGAGIDTLEGGDGDDRLDGGSGDDVLEGFNGSDTYVFGIGHGHDRVIAGGTTVLPGTRDTVEFTNGLTLQDVSLVRGSQPDSTNINDLVVTIAATGDSLTYGWLPWQEWDYGEGLLLRFGDGTEIDLAAIRALVVAGNDTDQHLWGYATDDVIDAAGGNDTVDGASGNDTLAGGDGDDYVDGNSGDDEVTGGSGNDTVLGRLGNDRVDGGAGNDLLYGGAGSDTFIFGIGSGNDTINDQDTTTAKLDVVSLQSGISTSDVSVVRSGVDMVLSVVPTGDTLTVKNFFLADVVPGSSAEAYRVDQILFSGGPTWDIAAIKARALEGSDSSQALTAYATSDSVSAAGGNDTVYGESGDDTVDGGQGNDEIYGGSDNDSLFGSAGSDRLFGDAGNDQLDGGGGNDLLTGGEGSDIYLFGIGSGTDQISNYDPSAGRVDRIVVGAGVTLAGLDVRRSFNSLVITVVGSGDSVTVVGFYDSVVSEVDFLTLNDGTTLDAAALRAIAAAAPDLPLTLVGTNAADSLVGASANDSLSGLAGNDTLIGNAGDDLLDGGTGNDSMVGGLGNDTFVVDSASDTLNEATGQGTDTVQSSVTFTLPSTQNVEHLTLTGTANINATGNTLANVLIGNAGNNTINGGTGADTLIGGAGNDTYVVDNIGDMVTELAGEGTDLVQAGISIAALAANVENLTLTGSSGLSGTGNALDNVITGNSGANTLNGGAGNDRIDGGSGTDTMVGGAGDDTYVVNASADVVTELAGEGTDTIESTVTLTLGSGNTVENLRLLGTSAISATGNGLGNVLTGNSANNTLTGNAGDGTLDGGGGTDTMRGGIGNDIYVVERSADVTTENANEGTDTVRSSVTRTLGSNLENLTLTGTSAINGTGNTLANVLVGNGAVNTLAGLAGNDTYDGAGGNDALTDTSTTSNDVYRWGLGYGVDTVSDAGGTDRVEFGAGITAAQLVFSHVGNNLEVTVSGNAADKLVIGNHYVGTANRVETFQLSDGTTVSSGQIPLSLASRQFAATDASADSALDRQQIMPVRVALEATPAAPAQVASRLPWKLWSLRDDMLLEPAEVPPSAGVTSAIMLGQAHGLISAMAAFGAGDQAALQSERQTIMPVRVEPLWVSSAVM